jgi:hypothetical protein
MDPPQKIVGPLDLAGRLERVHAGAERIEAAHDVFDRAVLAGGVAALQHDQEAALATGVEALLEVEHRASNPGIAASAASARDRRRRSLASG